MTKVKFLKDTKIRGQWYEPGQVAEIDDHDADLLRKSGAVESSRSQPVAPRAMKQVRFLRPTKVDGRNHGAGAYVELEERKAEALRAADVVVFPGESGWTGDPGSRSGTRRREKRSLSGKE
ncbi:DUF7210 family protein [Singulisphaera acidiphila]|uniref:DUF7210 domain-containing protein n=1 Tax=Singulisphaera acidiphila (strain ATCC BAA-1392 / DSM 18658 / VKM B-2454 / MOB10) TaxID=886293 RepID=L0DHJ2_SINAD|nr:hypothetical protein [Singulisphaera acidiphila]AGA28727.1 hypothetical protein Sinac_4546 [Singulisphaera acidiphila DSM 18658]